MGNLNIEQFFNYKNGKTIIIIFLSLILTISLVKCFTNTEGYETGNSEWAAAQTAGGTVTSGIGGSQSDISRRGDWCPDFCEPSGSKRGTKFPCKNSVNVAGYYQLDNYDCSNSTICSVNDSACKDRQYINKNCTKNLDCIQCGLTYDYGCTTDSDIGSADFSFNGPCPTKAPAGYFSSQEVCNGNQVVIPNATDDNTILPEEYNHCKALPTTSCGNNTYLYGNKSGRSITYSQLQETSSSLPYLDTLDAATRTMLGLSANESASLNSSIDDQYSWSNNTNINRSDIFNSSTNSAQWPTSSIWGNLTNWPNDNTSSNTSSNTSNNTSNQLTDDIVPSGTNLSNPAKITSRHCKDSRDIKYNQDGTINACWHQHGHLKTKHHYS